MKAEDETATPERLPKLCSEVHVCFPPRPTYCPLCRAIDPADCPYPELRPKP